MTYDQTNKSKKLFKTGKGLRPKKRLMKKFQTVSPPKQLSRTAQNRQLFLQYVHDKYGINILDAAAWSGTALHLLELSNTITGPMHQAAKDYYKFSTAIIATGPKRLQASQCQPRYDGTPVHHSYDRPEDKEFEMYWRDITNILDSHQTKRLMDDLRSDQDLPCLETLLTTESVLQRLKKSLLDIENYLDRARSSSSTC
jgi:hypothetical protein